MKTIRIAILMLLTIAAVLLPLAMTGCGQPPHAVTFVLVDGSCSRVNLQGYQDAWNTVTATIAPGDRLVLGRVTAEVLQFRPDLDIERPTVSTWMDNQLARQRRDASLAARIQPAMAAALSLPCSQRTPLLESLDIAARLFAADGRPVRRLVILSDMLEDSDSARFDRAPMSAATAVSLVAQRRTEAGLPNLAGVEVYIAGASAPSAEIMRGVRQFWMDYFQAAGASLRPEHYGPMLFDFK